MKLKIEDPRNPPEGSNGVITNQQSERPNFKPELMEEVLSQSNLQLAFKRVRKNKGAPGVDSMQEGTAKR